MHSLTFSPYASSWLNLLRWFSALLVVAGHLRSVVFVTWQEVEHKSLFNEALYFMTRFGHEAVVIFFVISGLLVGFTTLKKIQQGIFHFEEYFMARFSRIYIVLIPALLVGGLMDYLGMHYFNADDFYKTGNSYTSAFNYNVADRFTLKNLFANLFMLQNHKGFSTFGSNSPLWSLAYEWFYYMLFPLITMSFYAKSDFKKGFLFCLSGILFLFMTPDMRLYFLIWLMGVSLPYLNFSFISKIPLALFAVLAVCTFLLKEVIFYLHDHVFITDILISISISLFLVKILSVKTEKASKWAFLNDKMAQFSYSTYVLHMPIIVFLANLLTLTDIFALHTQPTLRGGLVYILLLFFTLFICYLFYFFTEKRTDTFRKNMIQVYKNLKFRILKPALT